LGSKKKGLSQKSEKKETSRNEGRKWSRREERRKGLTKTQSGKRTQKGEGGHDTKKEKKREGLFTLGKAGERFRWKRSQLAEEGAHQEGRHK